MINSIDEIIGYLKNIDESAIKNGISHHYIDARINKKEIVIGANSEGLIHLALSLLQLSIKTTEGSHIHFDSDTMLDNSDVEIVFVKKEPHWD